MSFEEGNNNNSNPKFKVGEKVLWKFRGQDRECRVEEVIGMNKGIKLESSWVEEFNHHGGWGEEFLYVILFTYLDTPHSVIVSESILKHILCPYCKRPLIEKSI